MSTYPHPSKRLEEQLDKAFRYHPPQTDQVPRYDLVRAKARELADFIVAESPESREQSLALTRLEEVVMWTNAAIARNEPIK